MSQRCRSCGAEVIWRRSNRTRKLAPLDAEPSAAGNCAVWGDGEHYAVLSGAALEQARLDGVPLRLSHFATCPDAPSWKRPGGAR